MRSERWFVPMIVFGLLWLGLGCSLPPDRDAPVRSPPVAPYSLHLELGARFQEAEGMLYAILLPNSMARTVPRTDEEVVGQIARFHAIAASFVETPPYAVPFLHGLVVGTRPGKSDPGLCALQLLYEIGTEEAFRVIESARDNPDEVVSRTARQMTADHQDLFCGFGAILGDAPEQAKAANPRDPRQD